MSDGALLATGCGIFFLFCAGVYMYLRAEILPRSEPPVVDVTERAA